MPNVNPYTAHPKGDIDVWIDWSGFTAVIVCAYCGGTEFGGVSLPEARKYAFYHRKTHSEIADLKKQPYIRKLHCVWGTTYWGEALGETCEKESQNGPYCSTHYSRVFALEKMGTCTVEGCFVPQDERQHMCKTHAAKWAADNGYMKRDVGPYGSVVIP